MLASEVDDVIAEEERQRQLLHSRNFQATQGFNRRGKLELVVIYRADDRLPKTTRGQASRCLLPPRQNPVTVATIATSVSTAGWRRPPVTVTLAGSKETKISNCLDIYIHVCNSRRYIVNVPESQMPSPVGGLNANIYRNGVKPKHPEAYCEILPAGRVPRV